MVTVTERWSDFKEIRNVIQHLLTKSNSSTVKVDLNYAKTMNCNKKGAALKYSENVNKTTKLIQTKNMN